MFLEGAALARALSIFADAPGPHKNTTSRMIDPIPPAFREILHPSCICYFLETPRRFSISAGVDNFSGGSGVAKQLREREQVRAAVRSVPTPHRRQAWERKRIICGGGRENECRGRELLKQSSCRRDRSGKQLSLGKQTKAGRVHILIVQWSCLRQRGRCRLTTRLSQLAEQRKALEGACENVLDNAPRQLDPFRRPAMTIVAGSSVWSSSITVPDKH